MQPIDFTTLTAICAELQTNWLPARLEQVYQRDAYTICLALRTIDRKGWLTLSWHPQAARISIGPPPPRTPDTFTFSQQLRHQLGNLALVEIAAIAPWERVLDLQFGQRPGEAPLWHLYAEIQGKYSNVILTDKDNVIVTAAHQVNAQQSSVRPILTGQPYEVPPRLTDPAPSLEEDLAHWQERVSLISAPLQKNLLKSYRGLSSALVLAMLRQAKLDPQQLPESLTPQNWQTLFDCWQDWLTRLQTATFIPGFTPTGYTVLGWEIDEPCDSVHVLIDRYYTQQLNQQEFSQLRHQLSQKINHLLQKLRLKAADFTTRLSQSDRAEEYRQQADLLMAHLQEWRLGMTKIILADFITGAPVTLSLDPTKNAVQNAQALYKRHQKLRRARGAIEPLLTDVLTEIHYLEQVEVALDELADYQQPADLETLEEIRDELIQQNYLADSRYRGRSRQTDTTSQPFRYRSPNGLEVLVGRNNRQNDDLTFRVSNDYDLWFHTQEIPGSHVLLRLPPGTSPEPLDLQFAADAAAYHSRARQSEQVPVVYTKPRFVYKPKGAKPGMTVYKQEQVIWGSPPRHAQVAMSS